MRANEATDTGATTLFDLQGRGIAVTGGASHLGRALALGLAEMGARVVICGRTRRTLDAVVATSRERKTAGRVLVEVADVHSPEDVARVADRVVAEAGALHGWVNNACHGVFEVLAEMSTEGVEATLSGVLADVMLCTREAAARMRDADGGSIVNVASMYGVVSPQPRTYDAHPEFHNPPAYGAAKAGVLQFTRYAACHYAPRGIRVNSVSPGPFPRDAIRMQSGFSRELEARVPLGRVGEPVELVGPTAFLLSRAASYVTGTDLSVDGGWTAW